MAEAASRLPRDVALLKMAGVRMIVRVLIASADFSSRVWSKARAAAFFPTAESLACHWSVEVKYAKNIRLGKGVVIGKGVTLGAKGEIVLEDHVRISKGVIIESAGLDFSGPPPYRHVAHRIVIGRGAWIGANAVILGGVTIGAGAVIGAGTVVSKNIEPGAVVVGARNRVLDK